FCRPPRSTHFPYTALFRSYAELHRRAAGIATRLAELGAGPEVLVGVCAGRSPELVAALLAVLHAGAAHVPLAPTYPAERLRFTLDRKSTRLNSSHGSLSYA